MFSFFSKNEFSNDFMFFINPRISAFLPNLSVLVYKQGSSNNYLKLGRILETSFTLYIYSCICIYYIVYILELNISMAHWFHRNPLKASKAVNFDALKLIAKTPVAAKLCGYVFKLRYTVQW